MKRTISLWLSSLLLAMSLSSPVEAMMFMSAGKLSHLHSITYATWSNTNIGSSMSLDATKLIATNSNSASVIATIGISGSQKVYWEETLGSVNNYGVHGIGKSTTNFNVQLGTDVNANSGWGVGSDGKAYHNSITGAPYMTAPTVGMVLGFALDMGAGTLVVYRSCVSQGTMFSGLSGTIYPAAGHGTSVTTTTANFGASAFSCAVPTGFQAGVY